LELEKDLLKLKILSLKDLSLKLMNLNSLSKAIAPGNSKKELLKQETLKREFHKNLLFVTIKKMIGNVK